MFASKRIMKWISFLFVEMVILWSFLYVTGEMNLSDATAGGTDLVKLENQVKDELPGEVHVDEKEVASEVESKISLLERAIQEELEHKIRDEAKRHSLIYKVNESLVKPDIYSPAVLQVTKPLTDDEMDRIYFLCDSPTYWIWPFGLLSEGADTDRVWTGPTGTMTLTYHKAFKILDPSDGREKLIPDAALEHQPHTMILALGINGISFMGEEKFKEVYSELIQDIQQASPETLIILQAIYPITPDFQYWGDITNVTVTRANAWIQEVALTNDCKYLNVFDVFFDEDGALDYSLFRSDGLHPNKDGLTKVLDYIRHHGHRQGF